MTLSEIVTAAPALQKLIMQDVPIKFAYALAQLINKCNPQLDFYGREIVKSEDSDRRQELLDLVLEEFDGYEPLVLPLDINVNLSAADIKCLEPLVRFE